ncbi:hypothetical protein EJB06_10995 [Massilia atriviolacea]|uniref:Uncharacterized protein n=2 Tax=Massilia atriviolacea TaxID=2495579 RepID=A0A430HN13_9BURK|nr:hypothetical protein EJB06_10995 [Massilia atriviolacea]
MIIMMIIGGGCAGKQQGTLTNERIALYKSSHVADRMFEQRCLGSGEKIYKQILNVEGVRLLKLRGEKLNFSDQYVLDDPYGSDLAGDGYIKSFFRDFYIVNRIKPTITTLDYPPRFAYNFVEVMDDSDGKIYRYTGSIDEPWLRNKAYLKGHRQFLLNRNVVSGPSARYGVVFNDISTKEDRDYWIAGSSLQVIDMVTNEILAVRIGYMYDPGQGNTDGGRAPWIVAANHSCPSFGTRGASVSQMLQTEEFVEKVLIPKK